MAGATSVTYNDRKIRSTFSMVEIHGNYNRRNKIIAMSQPIIFIVNKIKLYYHQNDFKSTTF